MFAKERQTLICNMVKKDGAVTTGALVEQLEVSVETIRRDLLELEKAGKLTRVHGGAVAGGDMQQPMELPQRNRSRSTQKSALSAVAAEAVNQGDIIAVDSGSTAIHFAQALKDRFSRLTVVTHSLDVFELLCDHADFEVILCGGHYLKEERAFYGPLVLEIMKNLHVRKAFLFPSAISLEGGVCDYQQELYAVQKQMMGCADQVFFLADSSKFERRALLRLSPVKSDHIYITDRELPEDIRRLYGDNGIQIRNGGLLCK